MHENVKTCEMEFSENYLHSQNAFFFFAKISIQIICIYIKNKLQCKL